MTPSRFSRFAERAFPYRWWLGALALLGFALLPMLAIYAGPRGVFIAGMIAGPLVGLPWAALCAAVWFHPEQGTMRSTGRWMKRFPKPMQIGLRWYGAIFLCLFVLVSVIAMPLLVLTGA